MPTIEIPDPVVPTVTIKLSGNRTVLIRQATGRDMMRATKMAGDDATATEQLYFLLARCISINGVAPKPDDISRMSLGAIRKITQEFNKLNDDKPDPIDDDDDEDEKRPIEPPS